MHWCFMRMRARWREHASWVGLVAGSKFDRCIHPTADKLSLYPRRQESGKMKPSMALSHMVTIIAINSRTLFVCCERKWGDIQAPCLSSGGVATQAEGAGICPVEMGGAVEDKVVDVCAVLGLLKEFHPKD